MQRIIKHQTAKTKNKKKINDICECEKGNEKDVNAALKIENGRDKKYIRKIYLLEFLSFRQLDIK